MQKYVRALQGWAPVAHALLMMSRRPVQVPDHCRVLKATDGKSVALSNFEGKKPVVLFFSPRAATPGCTREACAFRDAYGKFKDAGAEVFGISSDPVDKNSEFAKVQLQPPSSLLL